MRRQFSDYAREVRAAAAWRGPPEDFDRRNLQLDPMPYGENAWGRRNPHEGDHGSLCDDLTVDVWEERDRLVITVDSPAGRVAQWVDDDARQMFEDGFFSSRDLEGSVIEYVREMNLCHPPRHNLQPDPLPYGEHAYYRENAYRPNPMRFNTDAPRPTLTTASVFLRWLRRSQEAKMLDAEIDWDESGNRAKVRFKDGTQIVVRGGKE